MLFFKDISNIDFKTSYPGICLVTMTTRKFVVKVTMIFWRVCPSLNAYKSLICEAKFLERGTKMVLGQNPPGQKPPGQNPSRTKSPWTKSP